MKYLRLTLLVVVANAAMVAAVMVTRRTADTGAASQVSTEDVTSSRAAKSESPGISAVGAYHAVYDLRLTTHAALNLGAGPKEVSSELSGTMDFVSIPNNETVAGYITVKADTAKIGIDGVDSPAGGALKTALASGFIAHYDGDGKLVSVATPSGYDALSEATAHALAALVQHARRPSAAQRIWTAKERDGTGSYEARYSVQQESGATTTMTKEILQYDSLATNGGTSPEALEARPDGRLTMVLDQSGVLVEANGTATITLAYKGAKTEAGTTTTEVSLVRQSREAASAQAVAAARGADQAEAARAPGDSAHAEAFAHDVQKRELNGKTLAELVAELPQAEGKSDDAEKLRRQLFLKFRAVMLTEPERAADIARQAIGMAPASEGFHLLIGALASAGTPEAQAGLRALVDAFQDQPKVAESIIPQLGLVPKPTVESEDYLKKLAEGTADETLRSAARLTLGITARQLDQHGTDDDKGRSEALVKDAQGAVAGAQNEDEVGLALAQLGNTGATASLGTVQPYLGSPSPVTRKAAVNALRFVGGADAEELLLQRLGTDDDAHVRAAAATALGFREASAGLLEAETRRFSSEPSLDVRLKLLETIYGARSAQPEAAQAFIAKIADQAAEKELKEAAKRMIGDRT